MFGKKAPCDPRCDKHSGPVSQRVRRSCTKRIDFDLKLQANRSDSELDAEEPLIASMPIGAPGYVAHTPEPSASHYDDTTAPSWSRFGNSETFGCIPRENLSSADSESDTEAAGTGGTGLGFFEPEGADDCLHATDSEPDLGPDQLDYDQSGGTDVGYTSGSEADVDTDCDMYAELDDLEYISQASTRAPSPVLEDSSNVEPPVLERTQDEPADSSHEVPNHDNGHSRQATEDDANHKDERKELPDALRAFREWILTMSSTGDLTVEASESLLKTLNTCLEKDLLRCGPENNAEHRLPQTLATLQRHARQPSELMERYAVCPDFKCQRLRKLSSMDPSKAYQCIKCRKPITKQKITRRRGGRKAMYYHVPILEYSSCSIRKQLQEILGRPGILEAMRKHREFLRRDSKPPGVYEDIQDGELWQNFMKGDSKFFECLYNIGLVLMCDWFQPSTRQGAASYSVGAISLCIGNLPPHLRNRPENKILVGVTPGPHEPNVDTINHFLRPMVDELLELWNDGMIIKSEAGEPISSSVALVACACDSPAARKLGGFGGTGSSYPCTACWCSHRELHEFDRVFAHRNRKEHKRAAKAYRNLPNKSQKQKFISTKYERNKPAGYRDSALLRLPYWDATTMVVVDPMHCLFLGIVDWQFHTIWVEMKHLRPGAELDELQQMVQSTIRPRHCGRPPGGLGTSAAGSLTSDPLRSLVTIDLPLAIPIIWDQVDETIVEQRAQKEWASRKQAQQKHKAEVQKRARLKIARDGTRAGQQAEEAAKTQSTTSRPRKRARTQQVQGQFQEDVSGESDAEPGNPANRTAIEADPIREQGLLSWRYKDVEGILWLSRAIKRLCSRTVTNDNIEEGHLALVRYLNMCAELRGSERCRPNHHMALHIAAQLRRFGPMHQIWTYSGERLNFTLKNTNSNRHGGGERERSFAVTFHRRRDCITRLSLISANATDPLSEWAASMLRFGHSDARGTYEADSLYPTDTQIMPSPRHGKPYQLKSWQKASMAIALARVQPTIKFRQAAWEHGDSPLLSNLAYPIREVVCNGRIFSMSSLGDSIIKAHTTEEQGVVERVGEIIDLWEHIQPTVGNKSSSNTFACVRWYKASTVFYPRPVALWSEQFPDLDIEIHVPNEYLEEQAVIPTSDIICHCARMSATLDGKTVWLSIGLERE